MYLSSRKVFFSTLCTLALTCSVFASDASNYTASIDKLHSYVSNKNNLSHVSDENDFNGEQSSQWSPKLNDPKEDEFSWELTELKNLKKQNIKILYEMNNCLDFKSNFLINRNDNNKELADTDRIMLEVQTKINDLQSLYDKNEESIIQHEDWLLPRARYGNDDPETFINNIYERRMESQSPEEKARSILERDQLLRVLKENQEIESEN